MSRVLASGLLCCSQVHAGSKTALGFGALDCRRAVFLGVIGHNDTGLGFAAGSLGRSKSSFSASACMDLSLVRGIVSGSQGGFGLHFGLVIRTSCIGKSARLLLGSNASNFGRCRRLAIPLWRLFRAGI